jgi:serine/threonine protein phosphatase PrpC
MSSFTPGPWIAHWSKYDEGRFIVQTAAPSNRVLAVFDGDGDGPDAEEIASAHLIAAAPEMVAALLGVEAWADNIASPAPVFQAVRDAIAKATS